MSWHENYIKKRKKWRYFYRKFGITQRFNIKYLKGRNQIRVMGVKKVHMVWRYEDSHILFLESRAHSMSLQICISFSAIYSGCNVW